MRRRLTASSSRLTILFLGLGLGLEAILGIFLVRVRGPAFSGLVLILELLTVPAMLLVGFGLSDTSSLSEY